MISSEAIIALCSLTLTLNWGIQTPVLVYYSMRFTQLAKRRHPLIIKRNVTATIALNILCLLYITLMVPCQILKYNFEWNQVSERLLYAILLFCWVVVPHGFFWCGMIKLWTIYYDIQWALSSQESQWVHYIAGTSKESKNWYVANRARFGNDRWMLLKVWLPLILLQIIVSIVIAITDATIYVYYSVDSLIFVFQFAWLFVIYWKTPSFNDGLLFYAEVGILFRICMVLLISYIAYAAWSVFNDTNVGINYLMFSWISTSALWAATEVSTFYAYWFQNTHYNEWEQLADSLATTVMRKSTAETTIGYRARTSSATNKLKLTDVLSNKELFSQFMEHLLKEFAVENALAAIELSQFRRFCVVNKVGTHEMVEQFLSEATILPSTAHKQTLSVNDAAVVVRNPAISTVSDVRLSTDGNMRPNALSAVSAAPSDIDDRDLDGGGFGASPPNDDTNLPFSDGNLSPKFTPNLSPKFSPNLSPKMLPSAAPNINLNVSTTEEKRDDNENDDVGGNRGRLDSLAMMSDKYITYIKTASGDSYLLRFYSTIPKSAIVNDTSLSVTDKIGRLIDKYIRNGSEFQLNLSSAVRRELCNLVDSNNGNLKSKKDSEILTIFDDVISQLYLLLKDSFSRFKRDYNNVALKLVVSHNMTVSS